MSGFCLGQIYTGYKSLKLRSYSRKAEMYSTLADTQVCSEPVAVLLPHPGIISRDVLGVVGSSVCCTENREWLSGGAELSINISLPRSKG